MQIDHYVSQLLGVLSTRPDEIALRHGDEALTSAELAAAITGAAAALRDRGTGEGGVVALLTVGNSPATLIGRYAANLIGATVVHLRGINAADPLDELPIATQVEIVDDTGTTVLLTDAANLDRARKIRDAMAEPAALAAFGDFGDDVADITGTAGEVEPRAEGTAVLTYTSGTTGRPKGIGRGFGGLGAVVTKARHMTERCTMLVTTPLSHSVSSTVDDAVASGGMIVLHEGFDAGAVLEAVERHRVNRVYLATPQLYDLLDHPALGTTDHSSLRELYYGGSPASPVRLSRAAEVFGAKLIQIYGTTESWVIAALSPEEHLKPELLTTVGKAVPFVQVGIRDPHVRHELPAGKTGEICVRSPMMMDGYWKRPDLTSRVLIDGWLHTGDVGYLDENGYLYLVDRLADMIKTNGIKVYPAEVENALLAHPDVAQAAVFGVADEDNVEYMHAIAVPRRGRDVDPADLAAQVARVLSPSHVPAEIRLRAELPLTDAGKPDKLRLREEAKPATKSSHAKPESELTS
ncbi:AMP-binding protein [Amycolatopsis japonica]